MNSDQFNFADLFVLDLANNHQGSLEHGRRIVREFGEVVRKHGVRATLKFQFRQLDSFVHPEHQQGSEHKQVKRFLSTKLGKAEFGELVAEVKRQGMITMCTPFDEASVEVILELGFDLIKVASCSARDWPLLETVANAGKPVIFSTGGLELRDIDNLVSFFDHRGVDYAIMHCVGVYPIPDELFHLNQVDLLRNRYPGKVIGWSTHELGDDTAPIQIAVAKGAQMFERHVGIATETFELNTYSSTPAQVDKWIAAFKRARVLCGTPTRQPTSPQEKSSMDSLRRGVYAKEPIEAGQELTESQIFFAIPYLEGQMSSGDWKPGTIANKSFGVHEPIMAGDFHSPSDPQRKIIQQAVHEAKAMLHEARIALGSEFKVEYSHHYGIEDFRETGAIIIECVNRGYCKKLILQLPAQKHPAHFHKLKEETFQVLHGTLHVKLDGRYRLLQPGDTMLIQPGVWHEFWTDHGVIFEEISSTAYDDDSFYRDKVINRKQRSERKTRVDHWGRFQLAHELAAKTE